ncbi:hypothetical protein F5890DRAFT_1556869 [Lentinula detonsa]|uniref:Uncharacterized protein n=1 Tax=Lentinula detonsa TaxID=2804962 RepID=A0AA38PT25_9AGAR|nr:hypothetical protein F5890DRAFT_1556869 [Lentinula detonsa]
MSSTSSPACPVRSPTPVLNEEDAELQALLTLIPFERDINQGLFLSDLYRLTISIPAKREAQEKWRKLREEKATGDVVNEQKVVEEEEVTGKDVDAMVKVKKEVVLKVEPKPRKIAIKMVAGLPRGREMIPISLSLFFAGIP